jgi:hypothetical protein
LATPVDLGFAAATRAKCKQAVKEPFGVSGQHQVDELVAILEDVRQLAVI